MAIVPTPNSRSWHVADFQQILWINRSSVMRVLRLAEVIEKTGLARSTIYKYADLGRFPRPISLGGKSVGWIDSEIHEWLQEKQVERDMQHGPARGWGL
jgi:prophage regulatory protein